MFPLYVIYLTLGKSEDRGVAFLFLKIENKKLEEEHVYNYETLFPLSSPYSPPPSLPSMLRPLAGTKTDCQLVTLLRC